MGGVEDDGLAELLEEGDGLREITDYGGLAKVPNLRGRNVGEPVVGEAKPNWIQPLDPVFCGLLHDGLDVSAGTWARLKAFNVAVPDGTRSAAIRDDTFSGELGIPFIEQNSGNWNTILKSSLKLSFDLDGNLKEGESVKVL